MEVVGGNGDWVTVPIISKQFSLQTAEWISNKNKNKTTTTTKTTFGPCHAQYRLVGLLKKKKYRPLNTTRKTVQRARTLNGYNPSASSSLPSVWQQAELQQNQLRLRLTGAAGLEGLAGQPADADQLRGVPVSQRSGRGAEWHEGQGLPILHQWVPPAPRSQCTKLLPLA